MTDPYDTDDWRSRDTRPAPADGDDPVAMISELKEALVNVSELMIRLTTRLSRLQLAMLAGEHKTNELRNRADDLASRLGKIEDHLGLAAE